MPSIIPPSREIGQGTRSSWHLSKISYALQSDSLTETSTWSMYSVHTVTYCSWGTWSLIMLEDNPSSMTYAWAAQWHSHWRVYLPGMWKGLWQSLPRLCHTDSHRERAWTLSWNHQNAHYQQGYVYSCSPITWHSYFLSAIPPSHLFLIYQSLCVSI